MRVRFLASAFAVAVLLIHPAVRTEPALVPGAKPAAPELGAAIETRSGRVAVDPGGNRLVRVGPRGRLSTMAVFPARMLPAPAGGPPILLDSVPTSVVRGPDGAFYVGELTSFPHPAGRARVWRVVPGQKPMVYASGLTAVTALTWGPDRRLYADQARHGRVRI